MTDRSTILKSYTAHSGDQYAVAREHNITPHVVMEHVRAVEHRPTDGLHFIVPVRPRPTRPPGRDRLHRNILSVRHRDEPGWPVENRADIERARREYDAGYIELAQGRDGPWVIQYAFNRLRRARGRQPWLIPPVPNGHPV